MKSLRGTAIVLLLTLACPSYAEYCAKGPIKAQSCTGIFIELCEMVEVHAVRGENDKLHTINRCYPKVSDYRASNGKCWITTKSKGGGPISWGLNALNQPEFYNRTEKGAYSKIDAEYLVFDCIKR